MFIRVVDKFAVEKMSKKKYLYTEEIYTIEEHDIQGTIKNMYKIETITLNRNNQQKTHHCEYVSEEDFYTIWDIRNEPGSDYTRVPNDKI